MKKAYSMTRPQNAAKATIYLYDVIDWMGDNAKSFAKDLIALGDVEEIELRVNSPGGDVFDGIAIYNLLANHKARVVSHIDGLAASIASVIALAGDEVIMAENATFMIHNPWGFAMGDSAEMRKTADLLDKTADNIASIYAKHSGQTPEQIAEWMAAETWMSAAETVERGFATKQADANKLAASLWRFDLTKFKNLPEPIKALAPEPDPVSPEQLPISTPLRDLWESRLVVPNASRNHQ
jgi:ATP-dependent Clp endopeptidase proteolytic subunit ClpP